MADKTYRLNISYDCGGQFAMNVLHYRFDDGLYSTTVAAASALINAFDTHCTAALKSCLSSSVRILSYKARSVQGSGGFEAVKLGVIGDVGTRGGNLSVSGLAPWIRFITNTFPPATGRIFLPGISDNDANVGYIQAGLWTNMNNLANLLDDNLTLAGGGGPTAHPVVFSRVEGGGSFAITIAVPSPYLSQQRKRQRPA